MKLVSGIQKCNGKYFTNMLDLINQVQLSGERKKKGETETNKKKDELF